jgi:hypothetical protein
MDTHQLLTPNPSVSNYQPNTLTSSQLQTQQLLTNQQSPYPIEALIIAQRERKDRISLHKIRNKYALHYHQQFSALQLGKPSVCFYCNTGGIHQLPETVLQMVGKGRNCSQQAHCLLSPSPSSSPPAPPPPSLPAPQLEITAHKIPNRGPGGSSGGSSRGTQINTNVSIPPSGTPRVGRSGNDTVFNFAPTPTHFKNRSSDNDPIDGQNATMPAPHRPYPPATTCKSSTCTHPFPHETVQRYYQPPGQSPQEQFTKRELYSPFLHSDDVPAVFLDTQPKVCCAIQHSLRERIYKQKVWLNKAHEVLAAHSIPTALDKRKGNGNVGDDGDDNTDDNDNDDGFEIVNFEGDGHKTNNDNQTNKNNSNNNLPFNPNTQSSQIDQSESDNVHISNHVDFYSDFNEASRHSTTQEILHNHPLNANLLELPSQFPSYNHRRQTNPNSNKFLTSPPSSSPNNTIVLSPFNQHLIQFDKNSHSINPNNTQNSNFLCNSPQPRPNPLEKVPSNLLHMQCIALPPSILNVGLRSFKLHPYYTSGIAGLLFEQRTIMMKQEMEEKEKEEGFFLNSSLASSIGTKSPHQTPSRNGPSSPIGSIATLSHTFSYNNFQNAKAASPSPRQPYNPFKQHCAGHVISHGSINPMNPLNLVTDSGQTNQVKNNNQNYPPPHNPHSPFSPFPTNPTQYKPSSRSTGSSAVVTPNYHRCFRLNNSSNTSLTTLVPAHPTPPPARIHTTPLLPEESVEICNQTQQLVYQSNIQQLNNVNTVLSNLEHTLLCSAPISSLTFISPDTTDTFGQNLVLSQSNLTQDDLLHAAKEIDDSLLNPHPSTIESPFDSNNNNNNNNNNSQNNSPFHFLHNLPITPTSPLVSRQSPVEDGIVGNIASRERDSFVPNIVESFDGKGMNHGAGSSTNDILDLLPPPPPPPPPPPSPPQQSQESNFAQLPAATTTTQTSPQFSNLFWSKLTPQQRQDFISRQSQSSNNTNSNNNTPRQDSAKMKPRPRQRRALFIQAHDNDQLTSASLPPLPQSRQNQQHLQQANSNNIYSNVHQDLFPKLPTPDFLETLDSSHRSPQSSTTSIDVPNNTSPTSPSNSSKLDDNVNKQTDCCAGFLTKPQPLASIDEMTFFSVSGHPAMEALVQLRSELQHDIQVYQQQQQQQRQGNDAETKLSELPPLLQKMSQLSLEVRQNPSDDKISPRNSTNQTSSDDSPPFRPDTCDTISSITTTNSHTSIKDTISYLLHTVLFQDEEAALQNSAISSLQSPHFGSTSSLHTQSTQDPIRVNALSELLLSPRSSESSVDMLLILSTQCAKQIDLCWAQLERTIFLREQLLGTIQEVKANCAGIIAVPGNQSESPETN